MKKYYCFTCNMEALPQRKYCSKCREEKRKLSKHPRGKSTYEYLKDARRKQKEWAVEYLGGKCIVCGYNKCMRALVFHHKDSKEKEFSIGQASPYMKEDDLKVELDKCTLLCANCHAELHDKLESI